MRQSPRMVLVDHAIRCSQALCLWLKRQVFRFSRQHIMPDGKQCLEAGMILFSRSLLVGLWWCMESRFTYPWVPRPPHCRQSGWRSRPACNILRSWPMSIFALRTEGDAAYVHPVLLTVAPGRDWPVAETAMA